MTLHKPLHTGDAMLKSLRHKFIALTMVIVALIVGVTFSVLGIINHQQSENAVYTELEEGIQRANNQARIIEDGLFTYILEDVSENDTSGDDLNESSESDSNDQSTSGDTTSENTTSGDSNNDGENNTNPGYGIGYGLGNGTGNGARDGTGIGKRNRYGTETGTPEIAAPQIGGHNRHQETSLFPLAIYFINNSGTDALISNASSAALSDETLLEVMPQVIAAAQNKNQASLQHLADQDLYFVVQASSFGYTAAFADGSSVQSGRLIGTLILVGIAVLLVFFGISILFSRWALKPVKDAWDNQQRFIADASHELKTPLTVILANNSILQSHSEDTVKSQIQWVESTQAEAERMQGLVESLLQLTRLDNRSAPDTIPVDMSDIVEAEALAFEPVAFERGLDLECNTESNLIVNTQLGDIEHLCSILIDNATKHATPASTVRISTRRSGHVGVLEVANSGEPIPLTDLPHLFDRFYQADKARTKDGSGGFGLGLAIAKGITDSLGGHISVESTAASGTIFTVELPLSSKSTR